MVGIVSVVYERGVRRVLECAGLECVLVSVFDNRGTLVLTYDKPTA